MKKFESEVIDRLARIETNLSAFNKRLDNFGGETCAERGCELQDDVVTLKEQLKSTKALVVSALTIFVMTTAGIVATIIWSPVTDIILKNGGGS